MASLDRAVALPEVHDVSVRVGEDLHLDVAGVVEVALDVHGGVGEVRLPLASRRVERTLDVVLAVRDAEALPAPAGRCLDGDRVADLGGGLEHVRDARRRLGRSRDDGHPGRAHAFPGGDLRAHGLDRLGRRADPHEPGALDHSCELGVLGEESVSRVDRLCTRSRCDVHDPVCREDTSPRRARAR